MADARVSADEGGGAGEKGGEEVERGGDEAGYFLRATGVRDRTPGGLEKSGRGLVGRALDEEGAGAGLFAKTPGEGGEGGGGRPLGAASAAGMDGDEGTRGGDAKPVQGFVGI